MTKKLKKSFSESFSSSNGFFVQDNKTGTSPIHCLGFGHPEGKPLIVLHGGPGAGPSVADCKNLSEVASQYKIVMITQRYCLEYLDFPHTVRDGAWMDIPLSDRLVQSACCLDQIKQTTFANLIEDIETVRKAVFPEHDKVCVTGGSWGGALAMLYAGRHPESVEEILLRATSIVQLSGQMNPLDKKATDDQFNNNSYFRTFLNRMRGDSFFSDHFAQEKIMDRLYAVMFDEDGHGNERKWSLDHKLDAAQMWRSWNISLQYSHGNDAEQVEKKVNALVHGDPEHAFVYAAIFSAMLKNQYPLYGPDTENSVFHAVENFVSHGGKVRIVHGIGDDICGISNASRVLQAASGERADPDNLFGRDLDGKIVKASMWRSRSGLAEFYPVVEGGHVLQGDMPAVLNAALKDMAGDSSALQMIYPSVRQVRASPLLFPHLSSYTR